MSSSETLSGDLTEPQHRSRERSLNSQHASRARHDPDSIVLAGCGILLVTDARGDIPAERATDQGLGLFHLDGDGYLDYRGAHGQGLVNQGWKDSGIAITNADGSLAIPPIALCEVQGYLYRAWLAAARLLTASGNGGRARALTERAAALRERFERDFWSKRLGCYVLALQRGGRPVEVVASNAGQVLWSGIASPAHAGAVARRLMEEDMSASSAGRTSASRYATLPRGLQSPGLGGGRDALCARAAAAGSRSQAAATRGSSDAQPGAGGRSDGGPQLPSILR
jgi:hypothetical protein